MFGEPGSFNGFNALSSSFGGGSESAYWPKPAWQQPLPGYGRKTPDVSALSDPYTGVPIVITDPATNT
jgi:subtilase family serine protease